MAESVLINNSKIASVDTITELYTSPSSGAGTIITAFTVANSSTASASYKAYIYDSTGNAVEPVIPLKVVVRDRFDPGRSIVNQIVPPSGTIRAENSAANALNFYASGIEL
jgi:hypothetical protein